MPNPSPFLKAALKLGESRQLSHGFSLKYTDHMHFSPTPPGLRAINDVWSFNLIRPESGGRHQIDIEAWSNRPTEGKTSIAFLTPRGGRRRDAFLPGKGREVPLSVLRELQRELRLIMPDIASLTGERTGGAHKFYAARGASQTIPLHHAKRRPFLNE